MWGSGDVQPWNASKCGRQPANRAMKGKNSNHWSSLKWGFLPKAIIENYCDSRADDYYSFNGICTFFFCLFCFLFWKTKMKTDSSFMNKQYKGALCIFRWTFHFQIRAQFEILARIISPTSDFTMNRMTSHRWRCNLRSRADTIKQISNFHASIHSIELHLRDQIG